MDTAPENVRMPDSADAPENAVLPDEQTEAVSSEATVIASEATVDYILEVIESLVK